jgi:hypothetical protein
MVASLAARKRAQVRLCRQRKREGLVRLTVWVDEADLIGQLRLAHFIDENARDPEGPELQALLQKVVELWIYPPV